MMLKSRCDKCDGDLVFFDFIGTWMCKWCGVIYDDEGVMVDNSLEDVVKAVDLKKKEIEAKAKKNKQKDSTPT